MVRRAKRRGAWRRGSTAAFLLAAVAAAPAGEAASMKVAIEAMDENGDGFVDKLEFMEATRDEMDSEGQEDKSMRRLMYRFVESLYTFCDADGDGVLSRRELDYLVYIATMSSAEAKRNGRDVVEYMVTDVQEQFAEIDTNDDGRLELSEFWTAALGDMEAWGFARQAFDNPKGHAFQAALFNAADWNGNGVLDSDDELRAAGFYVFDSGMDMLGRSFLGELDLNFDNRLQREEVERGIERNPRQIGEEKRNAEYVLELFDDADLNEDGEIDMDEARRLAGNIIAKR